MPQPTSRRDWLKITAALTAGLSISKNIYAGEQQKPFPAAMILLNSNENAYGPSANTIKAMADAAKLSNRYPDDIHPLLKQQLATHWNVEPVNILMGAGSSELLGLTAILASMKSKTMISPFPTFGSWYKVAELMGAGIKKIPLASGDKTMDLAAMLSAIDNETSLVYVCNPNNPTGTVVKHHLLRNFVEECSKKCWVLVDEAYTEFENIPTLSDMALKNQNIIVAKTFSKIYGLAGARIGYAVAHADTIKKLAALQPWPDVSVSAVTAMAAMAALKDETFVAGCRKKNAEARTMCYNTFEQLKLEYIASAASFVMVNISSIGERYTQQMQNKNIFVQYRDFWNGKWSRVSMGTLEEMKMYCDALKEIA
ncbi:MAG: histidinol-phosphate aminotransferase family protein [Chitinophagaceae bacterium]|nr:histidinol-phosphate aminotransferase family protein [Chitinophagaceae bacterium]